MVLSAFAVASRDADQDLLLFCLRVAASIWKIASGSATPRAGLGSIGPHLRMLKWRDRRGNLGLIRLPHDCRTPGLAAAESWRLLRKRWG